MKDKFSLVNSFFYLKNFNMNANHLICFFFSFDIMFRKQSKINGDDFFEKNFDC